MGRVRVPGLNFSLEYLRSEIQTFHELLERDSWMRRDNQAQRGGAVKGLTFIMLNLSDDVDRGKAWDMFHTLMDEYHDLCDLYFIPY